MTRADIEELYRLNNKMRDFQKRHKKDDIKVCYHSHYKQPTFSIYRCQNIDDINSIEVDGVMFQVDSSRYGAIEYYREIINSIIEELR